MKFRSRVHLGECWEEGEKEREVGRMGKKEEGRSRKEENGRVSDS